LQDGSLSQEEFDAWHAIDTHHHEQRDQRMMHGAPEMETPFVSHKIIFHEVDKDKDGKVSFKEATTYGIAEHEVKTADNDKDSYLSKAEFKVWHQNEAKLAKERRAKTDARVEQLDRGRAMYDFSQTDTNNDEQISSKEFIEWGALADEFNEFDLDKSGALNETEYIPWWLKYAGSPEEENEIEKTDL